MLRQGVRRRGVLLCWTQLLVAAALRTWSCPDAPCRPPGVDDPWVDANAGLVSPLTEAGGHAAPTLRVLAHLYSGARFLASAIPVTLRTVRSATLRTFRQLSPYGS